MRVGNLSNLLPEAIAQIEAQIFDQKNLQDVMNWALSGPAGSFIPQVVAEVVVQDEFTHDVIIPWRDGLVLVYDTT
ncbi:MAG: hypothetical protein ACRD9S_01930 [Pyrinomonadaceae bacterium]